MGHRHSPEEVGRAGRVCACDGGSVAAGAESVENLGVETPRHQDSLAASSPAAVDPSTLTANPSFLRPSKRFGATGQRAALFALRFYKAYLSILFAGSCRFQPTCSQYSYEAIERFGVARGAWLTLKRLARCQPLSRKFGYDPVPEAWDKTEALAQDVRHSAATSHEVPT
jgi:putative membrane protein insertion efficiency factor